MTIGNGAWDYAKYCQIGKTVIARFSFTWGSTTSASSTFIFTLPVTAGFTGSSTLPETIGTLRIYDASASNFYGFANITASSTTTTTLSLIRTDGTWASSGSVNANQPMTWTTSDSFKGTLVYEAA